MGRTGDQSNPIVIIFKNISVYIHGVTYKYKISNVSLKFSKLIIKNKKKKLRHTKYEVDRWNYIV